MVRVPQRAWPQSSVGLYDTRAEHEGFDLVVDRARHDTLLKQACAWIELTAHTRVPPQMRDAFVEGHAENRALRAMRALGSG